MSDPRILIVRTSAMGDIVHALPVLAQLRRSLPEARIGWVVEQVFAPLLVGHPDLDAVIPISLRTWRRKVLAPRTWRELIGFFRNLNSFSADIALDLMGTHKAGLIGAWAFAERRMGLARGDRREPSSAIWLSDTTSARGTHAVDHMLSVLNADGLIPSENVNAHFGGEQLPAEPWHQGPSRGADFALLHPRTAWRNKDYPIEMWSQVVKSIRRESGLETWVAWGPGEEETARQLAQLSGGRVFESLSTIPQLVALSRAARIVLGGDTGPVHLAHALGTPVVCVMGPTDPERNGPYQAPESAVAHRLPCSFCHQRLDSAKACLLNISPEQIVDLALGALG